MFKTLCLHPHETEIVRGPRTSFRKELIFTFPRLEATIQNAALLVKRYIRPGTTDRAIVFVRSHEDADNASASYASLIYSAHLYESHRPIVKRNWELALGIAGTEADLRKTAGQGACEGHTPWRASDEIIEAWSIHQLLPPGLGNQVLVATQKSCNAGFHAAHVRLVVTLNICSSSII